MTFRPAIVFALFCFPLLAAAKLTWETTELTLPAEPGQEQLIAVYKFKNTGETPVTIQKTASSCGCTVPKLDKDTYAPGESGELSAIFNVGERTGPQRKVMTVTMDDPKQPTVRLVLETDIPTVAQITPKMVLWRKNSIPDWKEITIKTDPANTVSVPSGPGYTELPKYELEEDEAKPGSYILRVAPPRITKTSQTEFPILVELPGGKQEQFKVYVLVR